MQHPIASVFETEVGGVPPETLTKPQNDAATLDAELEKILKFLTNGTLNETPPAQDPIVKKSKWFLACNG